ncbi:MAG: deoxyhypusine synthase [Bacteroidia bacterium]|nr:deoxyhypusine synthase [Bacteroidia bacterium]
MKKTGPVSRFMAEHYRHFNAATVVEAAEAYDACLQAGSKMMITLAGAMSTAELGRSLAEMIRQDKVHIITCTGANLEEDVFNLVAHNYYKRVPHYRDLSPSDEKELLENHFNRVTDTCIPEEEAMRAIEDHLVKGWTAAAHSGQRFFPHEFFYQILRSRELEPDFQIDPANSWLLAACEKNIPIIVPGWEDSTCGNFFASHCIEGLFTPQILKGGIEYMMMLADWYQKNSQKGVGFFQIGGGIAGDFPICVVPMLHQDLQLENIPAWAYFCQISDSTTSYGSYSGAIPNEKITWGKLEPDTPKFVIESDATLVAPLIFAWLLNW